MRSSRSASVARSWGHRGIFPISYAKDLRLAQTPPRAWRSASRLLGESSGQNLTLGSRADWPESTHCGHFFSGLRRKDRNRRTASRLLHQI